MTERAKPELNHVDRRAFLQATGMLISGTLIVAGCDEPATEQNPRDEGQSSKGKEAPSLADRVKAGELPPLEDRLPAEPLVVQPSDRIGVYGGTWNTILVDAEDSWLPRCAGYDHLVRWNADYTQATVNAAREIETNPDGTKFTFTLRDGMRWSDGEPFTADDLVFAYNDVMTNEDLYPIPPELFLSGDEVGTIEKLDEYTIAFTFPSPNALFLLYMADPDGALLTQFPRHYLEQYHQDHNSNIDQLVAEEDQPSWIELFFAKSDPWQNIDLPRIHPWLPTSSLGEGSRMVFERNPYYWKVDPEGSQLPYLDRVAFELIGDVDATILKVSNGDVDMLTGSLPVSSKPILARSREDGNYEFFEELRTTSVGAVLAFNLTHKDPVKREIFQNKDFRAGVSHAINREDIINTVYLRQGEPHQVAPREESPYYDEEMATQYLEYDPDTANSLLDRAGYSDRDDEGIRLGPDGGPISFIMDTETADDDDLRYAVFELVQQNLRDVGIDMQVRSRNQSFLFERIDAGDHDATSWSGTGGVGAYVVLNPGMYFPAGVTAEYAPLWTEWYQTLGASGEEPPPETMRQIDLYRSKVRGSTNEEEQFEAMSEILQIAKDYFYHIGISTEAANVGIVRNDFHNVPDPMIGGHPSPSHTNPEQYFTTRSNDDSAQ